MAHATTPNLGAQDFFTTTLSGSVLVSDTTYNLTAVPTASEGYLIIDPNNVATREVIYYNSKTSSTVTSPDNTGGSSRGLGGTSVQAHNNGVTVEMRNVAEYWNSLQNGQSISSVPLQVASNPYKFSYYRNGSFNAGTGSDALLTFDTQVFDTSSNYSVSTGKFTAPINGFYWFSAKAGVAQDQFILTKLYKNGSVVLVGPETTSNAGSMGGSVSGLLQLNASDYIQVYWQTFTGGAGITGSANTYFQGFLVSAT